MWQKARIKWKDVPLEKEFLGRFIWTTGKPWMTKLYYLEVDGQVRLTEEKVFVVTFNMTSRLGPGLCAFPVDWIELQGGPDAFCEEAPIETYDRMRTRPRTPEEEQGRPPKEEEKGYVNKSYNL